MPRPEHPLEQRLHHRFADPALMQRALVHRSFSADHNERLEFLGDAVLNLAVASLLYERLGGGAEGDLSRVRSHLVREQTLHQIALALQLPQHLRLGEGEARSGGRQRASILADALEALVGAVYLDAGFATAARVVQHLFTPWAGDVAQLGAACKDAKTALQERIQGQRLPLPCYEVLATRGAAHSQRFEVQCSISALQLRSRGQGASRRAAEQAAAAAMLQLLPVRKP